MHLFVYYENHDERKHQNYEHDFIEKNKATYIADVINLKTEKVLQDIPKASNGRPDSIVAYHYYKKHYWDNIDFKEDATMRNPFFFSKLKKYFEGSEATIFHSIT